jgi:hypothetical protein
VIVDSKSISIIVRRQDTTIPSWVPKLGKFRAFTLNVPTDSGPVGQAILKNWCGGTPMDDFSALGGVGYHGGGEHHPWKDYGGFLGLNLATRLYEFCAPAPKGPHQSPVFGQGDPTDKWGAFLDDGTPQSKHTYNGIQQRLAKWGAGPRGSLVRVGHTGGQCMPVAVAPYARASSPYGYSATWEFDPVKGQKKFTGEQLYDYGGGPATINDAPFTGIDFRREGWWSKCRSGGGWGGRLVFTSGRTGIITSYPTPLMETGWGHIHAFEDEDLLVFLSGSNFPGQYDVLVTPRPTSLDSKVANAPWTRVTQKGEAAESYNASCYLGYMGMRYCDHTNYKAFIGFDYQYQPDRLHLRLWILTPPPVGKRLTEPWVWSKEILESEDGSEIRPREDGASSNGPFSKLCYNPKIKSFPWTRNAWDKGLLLRMARMD